MIPRILPSDLTYRHYDHRCQTSSASFFLDLAQYSLKSLIDHNSCSIMTDTEATKEVDHATGHDEKMTPLVLTKYVLSCALLTFSIVIVGALMFTGNTRISSETNPWVCLLVCVS